jgi:ribosomal protein S18 acetylase RimI-like enzyme
MKIRRLTGQDAPSYWELRLKALETDAKAFLTSYEEAKSRSNPIEAISERLDIPTNYTYGAFYHNELVGVVTMLRETHEKLAHRADILAMYVAPEARRKKAGLQLLTKAKEDAAQQGIEQLRLTVFSENSPAINLYKHFGFQKYGLEKQAVKIGNSYFDEDLMVCFL